MVTLVCKRCGGTMSVAEPQETCTPCQAAELAERIASHVWEKIDPALLANDIIGGMELIAKLGGVSHGKGPDVFYARYRHLRQTRASDFVCDHNSYWTGYYS